MTGVIITGGLGVLGQAVAEAFLATGRPVALIDQAAARATAAAICLGQVDLADPRSAAEAFRAASAALGGASILVNVAGAFEFERVCDGDPHSWTRLFTANLQTCANMCRAAAGALPPEGSIINIGAAAALTATAGMGPYAASKAGVARLTESLAAELGGRPRVNAVLPLIIDTPRNRADMPQADPADWTTPEAVADVIVFLASDGARAINGALIPVIAPAGRGTEAH